MSQTAASPEITLPRQHVNPQRVAWGVMLIAFAVFCVLLTLSVLGVHYFLFQSTTPLSSQVRVSRGTVTVTGTDLRGLSVQAWRDITNNTSLSTDSQSQATLVLNDPGFERRTVAIVTFRPGSVLELRQGLRPRFEWSSAQYWINLEDARGTFDIFVPEGLERDILVTLQAQNGVTIHITQSGRYSVIATAEQVELVNNNGAAVMMLPDDTTQPAARGQRVVWNAARAQPTTAPALVNLLGNTTFSSQNVVDYNAGGSVARALMWHCNNIQNEFPPSPIGTYNLVTEDGRPSLHLYRGEGAQSHGESLCVQGFGGNGLDVSIYDHVSLRVTFKIVSHSLSLCGVAGSECPLMLRMQYVPVSGGEVKEWVHGFYTYFNPTLNHPLSCGSENCPENHDIINSGEWYTYESRNFRVGEFPNAIPSSILNVRFYASGHDYNVYVSEFALLVDQAEIPLPLVAPTSINPGS